MSTNKGELVDQPLPMPTINDILKNMEESDAGL